MRVVLDERLAVQTRPDTADGQGGLTGAWVTARSIWGQVRQASARKQIEAGAMVDSRTYLITVRADVAPALANRLLWRGTALSIQGVTRLGDGRDYVQVTAVSEVG